MLFISEIVQKVEDMQRHRTVPSTEVIKFLSSVNLDHIIPNKPQISARRFMVSVSQASDRILLICDTSSGLMPPWFG